jgi:hypothetical protein
MTPVNLNLGPRTVAAIVHKGNYRDIIKNPDFDAVLNPDVLETLPNPQTEEAFVEEWIKSLLVKITAEAEAATASDVAKRKAMTEVTL